MKFEDFKTLYDNCIVCFLRGSYVYGTSSPKSDIDHIMVVPDEYEDKLKSLFPDSEYDEYEFVINDLDYQIMTDRKFIEKVLLHDVVAIEGLYLSEKLYNNFNPVVKGSLDRYKQIFTLDKWKLRQAFSHVASNSWVKAKKKMTVEKDYDMYIGQKSLFHSLRLLHFAIDICEKGEIDYTGCVGLYNEIMYMQDPTWDKYYEKYHQMYNNLKTYFRILAERK